MCVPLLLRGLIADKPDESLFFLDIGETKKKEIVPTGTWYQHSLKDYVILFHLNTEQYCLVSLRLFSLF